MFVFVPFSVFRLFGVWGEPQQDGKMTVYLVTRHFAILLSIGKYIEKRSELCSLRTQNHTLWLLGRIYFLFFHLSYYCN